VGGLAAAVSIPVLRTPADAPEMRVEIVTPSTTRSNSFAISPDGRKLVFVASGNGQPRLWLRRLDTAEAQPLAGTEGAANPFWSPDSRSVAFSAGGQLKKMELDGGSPAALADVVVGVGGTWNSDGIILFTLGVSSPVRRVPASGGESTVVTKLNEQQSNHSRPFFLPGGRQFLVEVSGQVPGIYLGTLGSTETKLLVPGAVAGAYLLPGWLLFLNQGTLQARHFDPARGAVTGDPINIAQAVSAFSVSATGVIAYRTGGLNQGQLTWFDRSGARTGTLGPADSTFGNLSLSPDGRRVAVDRRAPTNYSVWVFEGARTIRSTFGTELDGWPIWSPDSTRIIYRSRRNGTMQLFEKAYSSGAGSEVMRLQSPGYPWDWSRDGRSLLYGTANQATGSDLSVESLDGEAKPSVFLHSKFNVLDAQFSPDGRWVAYQSNEAGQYEIYVRPFPKKGDMQFTVSTSGGTWARWGRDGKALYYVAADEKLMDVPITNKGETLDVGAPVALFTMQALSLAARQSIRQQYDVGPDGRFLVIAAENAPAAPITLLLNWHPERGK
jgi:Tol biopolymer transport system component